MSVSTRVKPWLVYGAGLILVGGALWAVLSMIPPWMALSEVRSKLVEIGLQVVVFGLFGGAVKLLLDSQAEYRVFQSDMLQRLGEAHKGVYRVRRLLGIDPSKTQELLGELMNTRQDLGAAYHVARFGGLRKRLALVKIETDAMREYLEQVITEALAANRQSARPVYDDFVDWQNEFGLYYSRFKKRYLKAKEIIDPEFVPDT